ncbi:MAG: hypothetical protein AAF805_07600 [Planctomycetota bacterium]
MRLAVLLVTGCLVTGCAGLPRIDPSGRRIFIWPERPAAGSVPSTFGGGSDAPLGNVDAPPVFSGQTAPPVGPTPGAGALTPTFGQPPTGLTTPPAGGIVGTTPATGPTGGPRTERLSITPSRMLAPVGSEVILKAGVCGPNDYLRTNRRIEWMLGQEGAGQFVTVGEQGEMDILRFPWQRPNKFDNAYAVGYAAPYHVCLRRGTSDASDDVQVRPGEAWITVTSASEGVSYVTATAPESDNWDARRATATIYWVDAQWRLPGPQSLQPGQTGTLTTTITRKSDGAPVEGWLVRYEVAQGAGARVGYEAGSVTEATTDASGNASVAVTPTDDQPGAATVRVSVIRPANAGRMPSPRLELGGGETTVSWTPTASPTPPRIDDGGSGAPRDQPAPPAPFEPPPSPGGSGGDPLGPPAPSIGPRIELKLARDTFGPIAVGDPIPVLITLINTGDRPAENAAMQVRYDTGLSSPADPLGEYVLTRDDLPVIVPGQSIEIPVDFSAARPGRHCQRVTVTADGMQSAFDEQCFDITPAGPAAEPRLRIETAIDAVTTVGRRFTYLATVYNDGSAAAENVRVEVLSDDAVEAEVSGEVLEIPRGFAWTVPRIAAGGRYEVELTFRANQPSRAARITTYALLGGFAYAERTDPIEVRPAPPAVGPAPGASAPSALRANVRVPGNPARVGQAGTIELELTNDGAAPLSKVRLRLLAPSQVRLNLTGPSMRGFRQSGDTYEFEPLQALGAGERFTLTVPYTPVEQRSFVVVLQALAGGVPVEDRAEVTVLPR